MGDYGASTPWNENSVRGCKRFLDRVYRIFEKVTEDNVHSLDNPLHKAIKKVSDDIEDMKYNTAIATLMALLNDFESAPAVGKEQYITFLKLLSPFAPHITEELWEMLGGEGFLLSLIHILKQVKNLWIVILMAANLQSMRLLMP